MVQAFVLRFTTLPVEIYGLPKFLKLISTGSLTSQTPVRENTHPDLVAVYTLLLAGFTNPSALTNKIFRGSTRSPLCDTDFGSPVSLSTLRHFRYLR